MIEITLGIIGVCLLIYLLVRFSKKSPEVKVEPIPIDPVPTAEILVPKINIKIGDAGEGVKNIQARLKELGYPLDVDGEFGPQTKSAVLLFQKLNKIGQTGVVGAQTFGVLMNDAHPARYEAPKTINTKEIMEKAADIALVECKKKLSWTGMSCEAEKYLAPFRKALGVASGRFSWCACFIVYCIREAGGDVPTVIPGTNLTWAYVPAVEQWAKTNGWWNSSRDKNFNPRKGDVVLFDWDNDTTADHIGIVLAYTPGASVVTTLEGNTSAENQSNGNTTAQRTRAWSTIRGFVRFE